MCDLLKMKKKIYVHMAKNTGIARYKKNPIELGKNEDFLYIWPFNLFAHLIIWFNTLENALILII
jgi:hypothetical protein